MSKFLIHFPVLIALVGAVLFLVAARVLTPWLLIPAWQALCAALMLILDGKNREERYRKLVGLLNKGFELERLPREGTVCGYFIRAAALWAVRPAKAG
ncbi:MAG: hypothetical protein PQJ60_14680 [Spirochaetales bacterium]|nr:hypothetical protein [Spirochaetales bacterium]